jgi:hypothetical protein
MRGIVADLQSERLIVIPHRWVGLKHKYAGLIMLLMSFVLGVARLPLGMLSYRETQHTFNVLA